MKTSDIQTIRAMEAMREHCAMVAGKDVELLRRQGHRENAAAREKIASSIRLVTVDDVADVRQVTDDEVAAFERTATRWAVNLARDKDGEYFYPRTRDIFQIWKEGVLWGADNKQ